MGEVLGIDPRWGGQADAVQAVVQATMTIRCGMAEVVALVYGNNQRSAVQYGGPEARVGDALLSYVYHSPWGLTSQGALYALMYRRYMALNGASEADLGQCDRGHAAAATLLRLRHGALPARPGLPELPLARGDLGGNLRQGRGAVLDGVPSQVPACLPRPAHRFGGTAL